MDVRQRKPFLFSLFQASVFAFATFYTGPLYADDAMGDNFTGIINSTSSNYLVDPQDNTKETLIHQVLPYSQGSFIQVLDHNALGLIGFSPLQAWGLRLWDKKSGRLLRRYGYRIGPSIMRRNPVCTLKSGSHWVAAGCDQGTPLTVVNLSDGKEIKLPEIRDSHLTPMAAQNNMLVTRGFESNIEIHHYNTPQKKPLRIENIPGNLRSIAVSEQYVAGGLSDHSIRVWDIHTGQPIYHLQGHTYDVTALAIVDGKLISAAGNRNVDKSLKVWDLATGQLQKTVDMPAYYAVSTMKKQGDKLITYGSGEGREIVIWNWPEMKPDKTLDGSPVDDFAYIQNTLYITNENGIEVIDATTHTRIKTFSGFKSRILALDANEKYLVAAGLDGSIYSLDKKTGAVLNTLKTDTDTILNVWLNDSRVFCRSKDEKIEVWDLETGKRLYRKQYEDQYLVTGALSKQFAVTTAYAQKIDVWDIAQKSLNFTLSDLPGLVSAVDIDDTSILLGYRSGSLDTYVQNTGSRPWTKQISEKPFSVPLTHIERSSQHRLLGSIAGDVELKSHDQAQVFKLEGSIEKMQLLDTPMLNAAIVTKKASEDESPYKAFTLKKGPETAQVALHDLGEIPTSALVLQPDKTWISAYDQPIPIEKQATHPSLEFNAFYGADQTKVAVLTPFLASHGEAEYALRWFNIGKQGVKALPTGIGNVEDFRLINNTAIVDTDREIARFDFTNGKKTSSQQKREDQEIRLFENYEVHLNPNGDIDVFDLETGKPRAHFKEHHSELRDLEINGNQAISRDQDKKICFWNILDANKTQCLMFSPEDPVYTMMMRTGPAIVTEKGIFHYYNSKKKQLVSLDYSRLPKIDPESLYLFKPTQNAHYQTGIIRTRGNESSMIVIWDLATGALKNTIETETFYSDGDVNAEIFENTLGLGYVSYAEEEPKLIVEFWNPLEKQSFLKVPGVLIYSSPQQAIIENEAEISVVTFAKKEEAKPYTLKTFKGELLAHDERLIWLFSQAQKSVMGIDKKTLNIVYQVDWDKRRPKFKGLSQETVLLEDDYQALHLLSTNKEKAVERYAKWYFFPTAFLRQKNDGTLLKQGDVNNYLHWVKNGQIKELEGL